MTNNKISLIIAFLLVAMLMSGCSRDYNTGDIDGLHLGNLMANADANLMKVSFIIFDDDKAEARSGTVSLKIVNDNNETVYEKEIAVSESDFVVDSSVGYLIGGQSQRPTLSYETYIPMEQLTKGSTSNGVVSATFTANKETTKERTTTLYGLPLYTREQSKAKTEAEFSKVALKVDQTVTNDDIQITLKRAGFYTPKMSSSYNYARYGDTEKEYFVAELEIKNVGFKTQTVYASNVALTDNNENQYDVTSEYVLPTQFERSSFSLFSGMKKTTMFAFEEVSHDATSVRLLLDTGYDYYGEEKPTPYVFDIKLK